MEPVAGFLQLTPHLHVLCPDGVFSEADDGAVRFVELPPPTPKDVARIATSLARRVTKALGDMGLLDMHLPPDDDAEALRAHALQQSLPFAQVQSLAAKVLREIGRLPPHPPLATGPPAPQLALAL